MMKVLILLPLLVIGLTVFSQSDDIRSIQKKIDNYKIQIENMKNEIKKFNGYIVQEEAKIDSIKFYFISTAKRIYISTTKSNVKLRRAPEDLNYISMIKKGVKVEIVDYSNEHYKVKVGSDYGYLYEKMVTETEDLKMLRKLENQKVEKKRVEKEIQHKERLRQQTLAEEKKQKENQERARKEDIQRKSNIIHRYGEVDGLKIYNGKIWLGMTDKMAKDSRGYPKDINRSVGSWGVHEQWVYNGTNLYFENGILTSWQD